MAYLQHKKLTSSGVVNSRACGLASILVGKDGTNDITSFSLYDGTDNTGEELMPTVWTLDATLKAFEGFWGGGENLLNVNVGLYAEFTCAGSAEIFFYFLEKEV